MALAASAAASASWAEVRRRHLPLLLCSRPALRCWAPSFPRPAARLQDTRTAALQALVMEAQQQVDSMAAAVTGAAHQAEAAASQSAGIIYAAAGPTTKCLSIGNTSVYVCTYLGAGAAVFSGSLPLSPAVVVSQATTPLPGPLAGDVNSGAAAAAAAPLVLPLSTAGVMVSQAGLALPWPLSGAMDGGTAAAAAPPLPLPLSTAGAMATQAPAALPRPLPGGMNDDSLLAASSGSCSPVLAAGVEDWDMVQPAAAVCVAHAPQQHGGLLEWTVANPAAVNHPLVTENPEVNCILVKPSVKPAVSPATCIEWRGYAFFNPTVNHLVDATPATAAASFQLLAAPLGVQIVPACAVNVQTYGHDVPAMLQPAVYHRVLVMQ